MVAGRKPKPTQLKILEGTFRQDRARNEPKFTPLKREEPPRWMKDRVARQTWKKLVRLLGTIGVATVADSLALEVLAITYSKWREATQKALIGIYQTDSGYMSQNPMINVELRYAKLLHEFFTAFGVTPSSRSRLELPSPGQDDGDEDLD